MANSLQDQLLKAGLTDKNKVNKAKKAKQRREKEQRHRKQKTEETKPCVGQNRRKPRMSNGIVR
ncbi:MAG: DUF2058 family protein [Candidatus Thiodiazotropha sp.]